jgi:hypothetical protein
LESELNFDLHFPDGKDIEHFLMYLLPICTSFKSVHVICPYINQTVTLVLNFLYISCMLMLCQLNIWKRFSSIL